MRRYRGPDGKKRLWFSDWELEEIAEHELRKASLLPLPEQPVVDIERLVERHLGAKLDLNASLPFDVLGQTNFGRDGSAEVLINKELTGAMEESGDLARTGRWRATVAHEGAHIILHRELFVSDSRQGTLLAVEPTSESLMRCLKREVSFDASSYDWREVQANKAMAALLMPSSIFTAVARACMADLGIGPDTPAALESQEAALLTLKTAGAFAVSRTAASIRLTTLGFTLKQGSQAPLT